MQSLFGFFVEVAKVLNDMGVTPVLYGSVGLYRTIGCSAEGNDIDVLVDDVYVHEKWEELQATMHAIGYTMTDIKEHEFSRGKMVVAFAPLQKSLCEIGVDGKTLKHSVHDHIQFYELSPEQFYRAYSFSRHDGYRREVRGKDDKKKLHLIASFLARKKIVL